VLIYNVLKVTILTNTHMEREYEIELNVHLATKITLIESKYLIRKPRWY